MSEKPKKILWRWKSRGPSPFSTGFIVGRGKGMVQINHEETLWSHHDPLWILESEIDIKEHP